MTILEPILYANGALRLTRHGAGKGDTVLVLDLGHFTDQLDVPDDLTTPLQNNLEGFLADNPGAKPVSAFAAMCRLYDPGPWMHARDQIGDRRLDRAPGFYHD